MARDSGSVTCDTDPPLLTDLMRFKPDGWSANAWAIKAGVSRTVWTDIRRHANPSRRTLDKLLAAAGSSLAEFEALRIGAPSPQQASEAVSTLADRGIGWRAAPLAAIPLHVAHAHADRAFGLALLRFDPRRSSGSVQRPASLAAEASAFALPVVDDAMRPRFRPGHCIIVVPGRAVVAGDDVLAVIGDGLAAVAEVIERRRDRTVVRQHRPGTAVELLPVAVHLIVGEAL